MKWLILCGGLSGLVGLLLVIRSVKKDREHYLPARWLKAQEHLDQRVDFEGVPWKWPVGSDEAA